MRSFLVNKVDAHVYHQLSRDRVNIWEFIKVSLQTRIEGCTKVEEIILLAGIGMATNKHATIRYIALDQCFSNFGRRFYIEDLVEACSEAIYEYTGVQEGVKRRQIFYDIQFMESEQGDECRKDITV